LRAGSGDQGSGEVVRLHHNLATTTPVISTQDISFILSNRNFGKRLTEGADN
jgi:hypothetical protein